MRLPLLLPLLGLLIALAGLISGATESNSPAPRSSIDGVPPIFDIAESYIRSQTDGSAIAIGYNGMGNCSSRSPCILGSCCNSDGQCGYRPEHCSPSSPKTCVANCDAKAPCGKYSADGKSSCPLNVCCSSFGFCGTSDIFCHDSAGGTKAGDNLALDVPSCGKNSNSASRRIAYYQSWNSRTRGCDKVMPNQLNLSGITHLVLAFATIDPVTFRIDLRDTADEDVYKEFLALPDSVSKWIGLGGFQFTDSDQPTHQTFSKMSSSKENRKAFTDSLKQFLSTYKFSGVDIDWEWPGNSDRGGNPSDKANQVELLKDMREALGNNVGLGVAIPAQYTYLQNMDLKGLEAQVDWLSILTYDLHGAWDATTPGLGPKIRPHTDLQEVDAALSLLWGTQIDPKKVNMGIANYGRGYTVEKKDCAYFGCTYTGPSKAGSCTLQEGILSSCEIRRLISEKHLNWKVIQGGAEVNEVTWDDQWIAWDDAGTLGKKLELANDRCLGGTSLWAIDYDVCPTDGGSPQPGVPGSSAAPSQPASSQVVSSQPSRSAPSVSSSVSSQPPVSGSSDSPPASTQRPSTPSDSKPAPRPSNSRPSASPTTSEAPSSVPPGSQTVSSAAPTSTASSAEGSSQANTSKPPASQSPAPPGSSSERSQEPSSTAQGSSVPGSSVAASSVDPSSQVESSTWAPPASSGASPSPVTSTSAASSEAMSSSNAGTQSASSEVSSSPNLGTTPVPIPTGSWTSLQDTSNQASTQPGSSPGVSSGSAPPVSASSGTASSETTSGQSGVGSSSDMPSWTPSPTENSSSSVGATTGSVSQPGSSGSTVGGTWSQDSSSSIAQSSVLASSAPIQVSSGASVSSDAQSSAGASTTPVQVSSGAEASSEVPQSSGATSSEAPPPPPALSVTTGVVTTSEVPPPPPAISATSSVVATSEAPPPPPGLSATTGVVTTKAPPPPPALSATTGAVTTSIVPDRNKCPVECFDNIWCRIFCNDLDFVWPPPPECWWFDWCRLWWGLTDNKVEEKDGKKCQILGCGCGWMGLPWGPGCRGDSLNIPFPLNLFIEIFGLFPVPCLFWGCGSTCGLFGCYGFCFGEKGCVECPKLLCPHGGPEPGPIPKDRIPTTPPFPVEPGKGPTKCEPESYKTAKEEFVFCKESVDLSSAVSATTVSTWASTAVTTSTSSYSSCQTFDYTISGCLVIDTYSTTTTKVTESNTISTTTNSTEGSACTRAPLSLDDDEGNNIPVDWDSSSSMFGSNTTDFASKTSMSSLSVGTSMISDASSTPNVSGSGTQSSLSVGTSKISSSPAASSMSVGTSLISSSPAASSMSVGTSLISSSPAASSMSVGTSLISSSPAASSMSVGTSLISSSPAASSMSVGTSLISSSPEVSSMSVGTSLISSSSAATSSAASTTPSPTPGPMDKNGVWRFAIQLWMRKNSAKMEAQIYDPNGNFAGSHKMDPKEGIDTIVAYLETNSDRPNEHSMPYGVTAWFDNPTAVEEARVTLKIKKPVPNCGPVAGTECYPQITTENKSETKMFMVESCAQFCDQSKPELMLLKPADLNCDDMNDADWEHNDNDWTRNFNCYLKGF